jgi:hypothetical protein
VGKPEKINRYEAGRRRNFAQEQAIKAQRGNRGIVLLFFLISSLDGVCG